MIPPKRFDIVHPPTEGCSEGLDAFRFFRKEREKGRKNVQRKEERGNGDGTNGTKYSEKSDIQATINMPGTVCS